jgi:hypothetical protein
MIARAGRADALIEVVAGDGEVAAGSCATSRSVSRLRRTRRRRRSQRVRVAGA